MVQSLSRKCLSFSERQDSKQNSNSQSAEKLFLTTNEDDDDMYILTSAAFKASFSESFLLLFFLFFFIIVLRSSSSSRGWCFSLVCLLFRRVFTIVVLVCISVLRSRNTKAREEKSLSKILSSSVKLSLSRKLSFETTTKSLSFFLSLLFARANASAVWWVKQSPNNPPELP